MSSNVSKGRYYKTKTKDMLVKWGYHVEDMEKLVPIFAGGKRFLNHKDICGADIMAMNLEEIILIQVKSSKTDIGKAKKEFEKYPFPDHVGRWIIVWEPRVKVPTIVKAECVEGGWTVS